jgi:hypothetical protein
VGTFTGGLLSGTSLPFVKLSERGAYVERPVGVPPSAMDSFGLNAKSLDDLATIFDAT